MFGDRKEILELLETKSKNENLWIIAEEFSELIKEVSKHQRGQYNRRENLKEEIADCYICLEMLQQVMNFTDLEIVNEVSEKMERNLLRLEE